MTAGYPGCQSSCCSGYVDYAHRNYHYAYRGSDIDIGVVGESWVSLSDMVQITRTISLHFGNLESSGSSPLGKEIVVPN